MAITKKRLLSMLGVTVITASLLAGCGSAGSTDSKKLTGEIKIDGSSTVYPISEAIAEEFKAANSNVNTTVGESGTGGGMKKFVNKEIDIVDASRPIKAEEIETAKANGVEYIEFKVAMDGITVVVNKDNTWATQMTSEQLNAMWKEGSTVKTWKDVNPAWPNETIKLYSPGTASGTFEYFTEAINKKAKSGRASDVTTSEDDGVLVQGVAGDKNGIAYFGYSYYEENKEKINAVTVNGVTPSVETIKDGSYKPLSRPLYIYVNKESLKKEEVKAFVKYYIENAAAIAEEVGSVALPASDYTSQLDLLK